MTSNTIDPEILKALYGDHGEHCGCTAHAQLREQEKLAKEKADKEAAEQEKKQKEKQQTEQNSDGTGQEQDGSSNDPAAEPDNQKPEDKQSEPDEKSSDGDKQDGDKPEQDKDKDSSGGDQESQSPGEKQQEQEKQGDGQESKQESEGSDGKDGKPDKADGDSEKSDGNKSEQQAKQGNPSGKSKSADKPRLDKEQKQLSRQLLKPKNNTFRPNTPRERFENMPGSNVSSLPLDMKKFDRMTAEPDSNYCEKKGMPGFGMSGGVDLYDEYVAREFIKPETEMLAQAILQLVEHTVGTGIYNSPRIDHKKLLTQMYSKNINLDRCGKEEMEKKRLLILCDVSGSTSALCNAMAAASYRVFEKDDRCTIIFLSNEMIYRMVGGGITSDILGLAEDINMFLSEFKCSGDTDWHIGLRERWMKLLQYMSTRFVVTFHDTDGEECLQAISAIGIPQVWMLNTCASGWHESSLKRHKEYLAVAETARATGDIAKEKTYRDAAENERKGIFTERVLTRWEKPPLAVLSGAGNPVGATQAIRKYISTNEGRIITQ